MKMERELKECIQGVAEAAVEPLVRFLPLIIDEMIKLVVRPPVLLNQTGQYTTAAIKPAITLPFSILISRM